MQPAACSTKAPASEPFSFPDPDEGLMRGYLHADLLGGKFFFVLSNGHLSYYELQNPLDSDPVNVPLGMLRLDDVHSVKGGLRPFFPPERKRADAGRT